MFPWINDLVCSEPAIAQMRGETLAAATGQVVEIGFGTGLNLPHVSYEPEALLSSSLCTKVMWAARVWIRVPSMLTGFAEEPIFVLRNDHDLVREGDDRVVRDAALAVFAEDGRHPNVVGHRQSDEPSSKASVMSSLRVTVPSPPIPALTNARELVVEVDLKQPSIAMMAVMAVMAVDAGVQQPRYLK